MQGWAVMRAAFASAMVSARVRNPPRDDLELLSVPSRRSFGSVSLVVMLGFVWGRVGCDLDREVRVRAVQAADHRA
jgi:hypothetical protein